MIISVIISLIALLILVGIISSITKRKPTKYMDDPVIQQLRGYQNWVVVVVPVVFALVGAIIGVLVSNHYQKQIDKRQATIESSEKAKTTLDGRLNDIEDTKIKTGFVAIGLGNLGLAYSNELLANGMPLHIQLKEADPFPFILKVKDSTLYISVVLRGLDGNIVAEIVENEWKINKNNYFKRNYDKTGFEVIDQTGIIKLQIDMSTNWLIRVRGVLKNKEGYIIIAEREAGGTRYAVMSDNEILKQSDAIPNLFKYPSEKNLGVRLKPTVK